MLEKDDPFLFNLKQKGIYEFKTFFETWEGNSFPNGGSSESGMLITDDERLFSYWFDYNHKDKRYYFYSWKEIEKNSESYRRYAEYPEFIKAKEFLSSEKSKRRLKELEEIQNRSCKNLERE